MKKLKFSEWKEKTVKGTSKGLSDIHLYREKIKYRDVRINDELKIEEGIILEYLSRIRGEKEDFKPSQQHLVGYYYISVVNRNNEDEFWIQGNMNSKDNKYAVFKRKGVNNFDVWLNWIDKKKAFQEFLKGLKKLFKVDLEIDIGD